MKLSTLTFGFVALLSLTPFAAYLYNHIEPDALPQSTHAPATTQNDVSTSVDKTTLAVKQDTPPKVKKAAIKVKYPATINHTSPLGINTNEVYEQDASIPFVDLFRVAAPFHENIRCRKQDQPCLTSAQVEYDEQGWPKNLKGGKAGVFFIRNVSREAYPEGNYTVLYDGEGKIDYLQNVEVLTRAKGEDTIQLTARTDGFMTAALQIVESNPKNPLKNIRILLPGGICQGKPFEQVADASFCKDSEYLSFKDNYETILFNPDYLNFMKDFSVIRFMPMSGITRNPAVTWDQRPKMDKATWGGLYGSRGAPLEIQIELANRLKANPWLNVPHAADDNYIKQFASYVHKHLAPELTPYIEYTNEAWNSNFVHNEYMQKMGIAEKLDQDALMAGYKYYAKRSVEFFEIWQKIYGGHDKFVRVISGWDTRPDISGIILAYNDTYKSVDALAIAPYIGGNTRGFRESKTVDDIFHLLTDKKSYRSLDKVIDEIKKHKKLADDFGVSLVAYEGGQGLVDWATRDYMQHPNPLFFAANRDPRMADLYNTIYKEWRELGAGLFVAFSAPRSCNADGCWGLKEHIRKDLKDSPKLQASLDFINTNDKWWQWKKVKAMKKPSSKAIAKYLPKTDPNKPRIVIRPAKGDPKHFFRLENPQALNILLEGNSWDKRDISGKWQVKWDKKYLYFSAKAYDKEAKNDSKNPEDDDSIEFFIDPDNSRSNTLDKSNDFHFIFTRNGKKASLGSGTSKKKLDIPFTVEEKYDGYEIHAKIQWKDLGVVPAVKKKLGMDVIINDDDDGGKADARLGWNTRNSHPAPKDYGMILMSGR